MPEADAFAPSMRQRIDVARLYRRALRRLPPAMDNHPCRRRTNVRSVWTSCWPRT